ncbi:MAG: tetratricopeptide repeat protein [Bacteroidota bacterium]
MFSQKNIFLLCGLLLLSSLLPANNIDSLKNIYLNSDEDKILYDHGYEIGLYYNDVGIYDSALVYLTGCLNAAIRLNEPKKTASALNNIALAYYNMSEYEKALDYNLKALKIRDIINDSTGLATSYNNLGSLYDMIGNYDLALDYHKKSLALRLKLNNKEDISTSYNNLGIIYYFKNDYKKSLEYMEKSYRIALETGNTIRIAEPLNNMGAIAMENKDFSKAEECFQKSEDLARSINDLAGVAASLINKGIVRVKANKPDAALESLEEGLQIADSIHSKILIRNAYESFSDAYSLKGQYKKAFDMMKLYSKMNAEVYTEEGQSEMASKLAQYETEKKERALKDKEQSLKIQGLELKNANAQNERNELMLRFAAGVLLLIIALAFFIFRSYRIKKKANEKLQKAYSVIEEKNAIVEEKNKEILDSIHYAKRIQSALLTSEKYISRHLDDFFVLYKPKDIVSGDFYWAVKTDNGFILTVADCTGHGVPGAFMSLLNISLLNEVVVERKTTSPEKILNGVREEIINALNADDEEKDSKDGMDSILMKFDSNLLRRGAGSPLRSALAEQGGEVSYAAANNSPVLIRDGKITELPCDKMPVGKSYDEKDFTLHHVDVIKGDVFYLYTDGYADQFGGPSGKKFKYKKLNQLLSSVAHLPSEQQKNILDQTIEEWKSWKNENGEITHYEQIDDICIIGIRF